MVMHSSPICLQFSELIFLFIALTLHQAGISLRTQVWHVVPKSMRCRAVCIFTALYKYFVTLQGVYWPSLGCPRGSLGFLNVWHLKKTNTTAQNVFFSSAVLWCKEKSESVVWTSLIPVTKFPTVLSCLGGLC